MTITEVISNFRDCLSALVPRFSLVGIPWKRPEAYDEWDGCAAALFDALVIQPLSFELERLGDPEAHFPDYDMLLPDYSGFYLIVLEPMTQEGHLKVFHAIGTTSCPLDTVEVRLIGADGLPKSDVLETIAFRGARFAIWVCSNQIFERYIDTVELPSSQGGMCPSSE